MSKPVVSLCIPTNGVIEWVFPVLNSIYKQGIEHYLFEVIITDNGNDQEFKREVKKYLVKYSNIIYKQTTALPFINEIEAYKMANGKLIKFVNHRTMLIDGTLQLLIDFAIENEKDKPIIYFSNGMLKLDKINMEYDSFDAFVRNLSYWSSWSTGMTIWKTDFDKLQKNYDEFNVLFPHTNILFAERTRSRYIIDNTVIFYEIPQGGRSKGSYDLFGAFGIEYPSIILELYRSGSITHSTYKNVIDRNLEFIAELYWQYCIRKKYCSYDLSGEKRMYDVFYTKCRLKKKVLKHIFKLIKRRKMGKQSV